MVDRFYLWLGAGVVAAGVTVGMLAGAGVAYGQTESGTDDGAKTSQSAKPADNEPDSDKDDAGQNQQDQNVTDDKPGADDGPDATADRDGGPKAHKFEPGKRTARLINNFVAAVTHKPDRKPVVAKADPVEKVDPAVATDPVDVVETDSAVTRLIKTDPPASDPQPAPASAKPVVTFSRAPPTQADITLATPMLARSDVTASAAPQLKVPPVVSAIGTAVFGLISFAESVFEGPPKVPPGSNVTVQRSTLELGDGTTVPADWYFPDGSLAEDAPPPERIIYLQHGFLARGVFYDYTAAYLAEHTNSVVVAPTLTSNIFATDGMWLGGEPMHRAVADLFLDDNGALLESAQAAGYNKAELPQNVVLVGHSLGGGLVIDTARFMAENEASGKSSYTLAGVLMLDGVSFTDPEPILRDIPDDIPVYNLSATPYPWNLFGSMDAALATVRPDDFHGAQLLGGLHSDSMVGGNPLVQFGAYLLTGFSLPRNVEGSQILAAGWINDMFAHTETPGFYGEPGSTLTIPTGFGPARALVQPTPGVLTSLLRELTAVSFRLFTNIDFATCAAPVAQETAFLTQKSTPNTALSLDGRPLTRHAVGQHVCTG